MDSDRGDSGAASEESLRESAIITGSVREPPVSNTRMMFNPKPLNIFMEGKMKGLPAVAEVL